MVLNVYPCLLPTFAGRHQSLRVQVLPLARALAAEILWGHPTSVGSPQAPSMEKMPYEPQPASSRSCHVRRRFDRPNDWRTGLPDAHRLAGHPARAAGQRRAALFAALSNARGLAVHLAAAGDGRGIRAVHHLGAPQRDAGQYVVLCGRAARLRHGDRPLSGPLARAGSGPRSGASRCRRNSGARACSSTARGW